jgi:hypothetical protein
MAGSSPEVSVGVSDPLTAPLVGDTEPVTVVPALTELNVPSNDSPSTSRTLDPN